MEQEVTNKKEPVSMKLLLEAGVHFGHQTRRWNPKMKDFIFTQRNGIHIIDLQKTLAWLSKAYEFVTQLVAEGGTVLFLGTKKQAQDTIAQEASRCKMFYVNQRWLGGTLTNFNTIQNRIDYLVRLEDRINRGMTRGLPKKEALSLEKEAQRLNKNLQGIKEMTRLPEALFVVDAGKESIAVAEANRMSIPVVAVVDTDGNPRLINHPIPANDDAIRSIRLITSQIANAVLEGMEKRQQALEGSLDSDTKTESAETPVTASAVQGAQ